MADGDFAGFHFLKDRGRKRGERPKLMDAARRELEAFGDEVPGKAAKVRIEGGIEAIHGAEAVERREVFPLSVLCELPFQGFSLRESADEAGDGGEASKLCGTEAAAAIDDEVFRRRSTGEIRIVRLEADDERLTDAVEGDIGGEAGEGMRIDDLARVRRVEEEDAEREVGDRFRFAHEVVDRRRSQKS